MGGETLEVSLLLNFFGAVRLLSTKVDSGLGGEDFDRILQNELIDLINTNFQTDVSKDEKAKNILLREAKRVKDELCSNTTSKIEIDNLVAGFDLKMDYSRDKFDVLVNLFKNRIINVIKEVLFEGKKLLGEVDEIILVGGSSNIPAIQTIIKEFFMIKFQTIKRIKFLTMDDLLKLRENIDKITVKFGEK